jgi:hypothetical protein
VSGGYGSSLAASALNSNLMFADQAAINAGFDLRRYPASRLWADTRYGDLTDAVSLRNLSRSPYDPFERTEEVAIGPRTSLCDPGIDGSDCLVRTKKIVKLAHGGDRSEEIFGQGFRRDLSNNGTQYTLTDI